ncbi:MAG TPA: magnesium transporter [Dehalococcoidia bacterium]|nr:magnesium transporter [Dehalococcoidia bacterium]
MVQEEHFENLRDVLHELIDSGQLREAVGIVAARHPADQADLFEELEEEYQDSLYRALSQDQQAELLEYLEEDTRARVLGSVSAADLAPVLNRLDEDVTADIVQDLSPEQAEQVVPLLEWREGVEELLAYPEQSAGGRMSTEYVALQRTWTVDEAIQFLRREGPEADQTFYVYVVDDEEGLTGVVGLRNLVTAAPETPIAAIMTESTISVRVDEDQEVAAERMRHYNLLALPVVDAEDRLRGVITADDVLDVQVEEATEDIYRMAGVGVQEYAFSPALESARRRIPWLSFNMVWAFAGAAAISLFAGTLEKVATLAIFMPMIAGQAGNAGIQTATIMVRSMALGEVENRDMFHLLRKEWTLGLIKGCLFGGVLGFIAWLWQGNSTLGLIAAAAMFLNMLVASTTGVVLPLTLRRLGIDPATIAGVFDTMITDLMGFVIYLGLATLFITQLT